MAASKSPRLRLLHMRDEIESLSKELAGRRCGRAVEIRRDQPAGGGLDMRQDAADGRHRDAPWDDIIAIGNPLRHEYHRIDDRVLWETATVDLPKLQPIILRMLSEIES